VKAVVKAIVGTAVAMLGVAVAGVTAYLVNMLIHKQMAADIALRAAKQHGTPPYAFEALLVGIVGLMLSCGLVAIVLPARKPKYRYSSNEDPGIDWEAVLRRRN
jgi:hypothetical protein